MQFVESKDLRPGMRLAKPIYNRMGVLLYDRNTNLTATGIKSIENFGLIGLFILEPAEPLPPISDEDIRFEQFQTVYVFKIREIMGRLQKNTEPEGLADLTKDIVDNYGSLKHKINFIQTLRSSVDFVYKHSVSVAMLSAMIAEKMGYSNLEKNYLVTASLLYDLGYLYVPRKILEKAEPDANDRRVISECRRKGYQLLYPETNKYLLDPEILNTIQHVHTSLAITDPADLEGKTFTPIAQILIVADKYDQLTAMSLHQAPVSEVEAIRYLRRHFDRFQPKVVSALARSIHILPNGCSIDLKNHDKGIVLMENSANFLAPVILNIRTNRIYDLSDPSVPEEMQIADIMKTMDNRIVIDEETLKQFTSDDNLRQTLNRFQEKKRVLEQKGRI